MKREALPSLAPGASRDGNVHAQPYAECVSCSWLVTTTTLEEARSMGTVHQLLAHICARK